jgi:hypothetical protein
MTMDQLRERTRQTRLMLGEPSPEIVAAEMKAERDCQADTSGSHDRGRRDPQRHLPK